MAKPSARCTMLVRCLSILRKLEGGRVGATLDELASVTGVSSRTIRRDLAALEEAGVPLTDDLDEDTIGRPVRRYRVFDWKAAA